MREIPESDWKYFRTLYPDTLERYCRRTLDEICSLAADEEKSCHERYLAIYKTVQSIDQNMGRMFDNPRRSTAVMQIMSMHANGLFTDEELAQFSEATRERVKLLYGQ